MELKSLQDLYVHGLKDVYSAEKQITKALPKMIRVASSPDLQKALEKHLAVTHRQAATVEAILMELGESTRGPKCKGMEGLLEEGSEMLKEEADFDVLDAAIIAAAQRVEHYEIAAYGTLRTYAETLGYSGAAQVLDAIASEEGVADQTLSGLAESAVNLVAAEGEGSEGAKEAGIWGRTSSSAKPRRTASRASSSGRGSKQRSTSGSGSRKATASGSR